MREYRVNPTSVDVELQVFTHQIILFLLGAFGVPGTEFVVLWHLLGIGLRVDADVHDGGLAARVGPLDRRTDLLLLPDVLAVAAKALGYLVESDVLAPVHARLRRRLLEGALVNAHLEAPLVVDTHHAHQRKLLPRSSFQLGDMEEECRMAGQQHHRALTALSDRCSYRVR